MARAFKLNDLQLVLLSTAAQRSDGSLLPPSDTIGEPASRIRKVIPPLIREALVDEVEVTAAEQMWRTEGEQQIGLVINDAGRAAIGVAPAAVSEEPSTETQQDEAMDQPAPRTSKIASVIAMLQRYEGATLTELVAATGWLPHTTRAALTGLRKKGHAVDKTRRGEQTCYFISKAA